MQLAERVEELKARHAELEQALVSESARPHPDPIVLNDIKKHKLRIKDEIARLSDG